MNPSDEIKTRLDIVDVIREYIPLKAAGVNFTARCPFHNEKSASFVVSPDKQIWHCFGCGKGGDIFTFVMEIESLTFVETLRQLAPKAGVELRMENNKDNSERNRLLDVMAEAVNFYHKTLLDHPLAAPARDYLEGRGMTDEAIAEWKIGFSLDDWDDLQKYLLGKGFKENEIFLAGLSSKKEDSARYYNRFRGRIMFPINDINGNPVAFTARVSPEREATEKMGKYINSPQTKIYDKGHVLFALDRAKQAIKQAKMVIVVEGQMDAITAHIHGYKNVVASSGTALTEGQIGLLKRFTDTFALAFDADQAGQMAIERGENLVNQGGAKQIEVADRWGRMKTYLEPSLTNQITLKVIEMPNGKDPDECIKTDPLAWEEAVKNAKLIMQYYFDKTLNKFDIKQVEGKNEVVKILLPAISKLGSKIEQEAWIQRLAQLLSISENLLFEAMPKQQKNNDSQSLAPIKKQEVLKVVAKEEFVSELLVALILQFIDNFEYSLNHLELNWLFGDSNRGIYKNLVIYYNQLNDKWTQTTPEYWGDQQISEAENNVAGTARSFSYQGFREWLTQYDLPNRTATTQSIATTELVNQAASLDRLMLLAEREYHQLDSTAAKNEIIRLIRDLQKMFLQSELKKIEGQLAAAEQAADTTQVTALLEEFKILSLELKDLKL